ncbi:DUF3093 domain-containing protein [Microbacterium memoriense]|uniref:DUF3093 domain-containing protein n=1 Tax=Microbacterium memoriense TaxID=2978350 RepID=A0ABT2P7T8_9MICO|nr:DUF3093 domain-containing protein [Microbacterium memoriense]MCT9000768.1 DUF3093 domain-containing protein [Microbacterium memoriense]
MHNSTATAARSRALSGDYRERLSPSLWALLSAAVAAPMVGLVFVPLDATVALLAGLGVATVLIVTLVASSPVVAVRDGELRVGRAHIPVALLGDLVALTGEEAKEARGPGLHRDAWHLLRPGVDGIVRAEIRDDRDPASEWVFSTRTPDRVVAAIRRAQRA